MPHDQRVGEVSAIYRYLIKSCAKEALLSSVGLRDDRRWGLVETNNKNGTLLEYHAGHTITQRDEKLSLLAQTKPRIVDGYLVVEAPKDYPDSPKYPLELKIGERDHTTENITMWDDGQIQVAHEGSQASKFFSDYLAKRDPNNHNTKITTVHLVRKAGLLRTSKSGGEYNLQDSEQITLLAEESVADLNQRLKLKAIDPISSDVFRANIIVKAIKGGGDNRPFREDEWELVEIDDVSLVLRKPVKRCPIIATNQTTGIRGKEPNATLWQYRAIEETEGDKRVKSIVFAQKGSFSSREDLISIGDPITLVKTKLPPEILPATVEWNDTSLWTPDWYRGENA